MSYIKEENWKSWVLNINYYQQVLISNKYIPKSNKNSTILQPAFSYNQLHIYFYIIYLKLTSGHVTYHQIFN